MTPLQKEAIIAYYKINRPGIVDFINDLFKGLEMNNVEFEPLVIPLIDLEIEKVIPCGCLSEKQL